ncbi:hypothetical protein, partial [Klebsiella pneumoniae]|uniref:cytidine deaminase-like fold-containing protein n=1 Tax=Klebsiella pneumoniae TaxID=573 RepID=UPI003A80237E
TKGYENHKIKISSGAENNAKSIPLKEQLSNEMLKAQGTKLEKIDVIARVDVNGRVYVDTNQMARAYKFSDPNKLTLIAENVAATDENINTERVVDCLKKAGLAYKLDQLPKGIDTQT